MAPKPLEMALEMLRLAAKNGTRLIVATPHGDSRAKWRDTDALRESCRGLNEAMKAEGLSLSVLLGMENPLELDLVEQLNNGSALHCNDSPYALVEFPYRQLPIYWEEALFNLQLGGKRPIIAHPERQTQIQENPELLAGVVRRGVMTQITAGSLSRRSGSLVRKTAETLVKNGLAHVIASDAHGPTGPRNTSLLEGFAAASKLVGTETATKMMTEVPRSMVLRGAEAPS